MIEYIDHHRDEQTETTSTTALLQEVSAASPTRIKVVGIGGGGNNAVTRMVNSGINGVEFIVINTDVQQITRSQADVKIQIGSKLTRGLGSGQQPDIGEKAAIEDREKLMELLRGADMVFITAGMGGGTGTGASPVIAEIAQEVGALTVGVVTKPFDFEGKKRQETATHGIERLSKHVDTMIVIPNQNLMKIADRKMSSHECYRMADDVLRQAIQGIADIITTTGFINVDFNDVRTVMSKSGGALMSVGEAQGEDRTEAAVHDALNNPLLENVSIKGATGVLINITSKSLESIAMTEIERVVETISENVAFDKNIPTIICGQAVDARLDDTIRVTVIATGFNQPGRTQRDRHRPWSSNINGISGDRTPLQRKPLAILEHDRNPAFHEMVKSATAARRQRPTGMPSESELEMPAVLRKRSDFKVPVEDDVPVDEAEHDSVHVEAVPESLSFAGFAGMSQPEIPSFLQKKND